MNVRGSSILEYASLGNGIASRFKLGLFRLMVSLSQRSAGRRFLRLAGLLPHTMWLRPARLRKLQLLIDPTDSSQTVIFDEVFRHTSYDLEKVRFSPQVVIDCGAHIGLFSLLARAQYPSAELIAYEPNPANGKFIQSLIRKNKITLAFNPCAISTKSADLSFAAINSHGGRLVTDSSSANQISDSPTYTVKAIDFPAALRAKQMNSLLLKMDIEGEERNVLPAIMPLLPRQTALFFETHDGPEGWSAIESLLASNGFAVEQLNARGLYYDGFASRS